jgi:hypothetical protein
MKYATFDLEIATELLLDENGVTYKPWKNPHPLRISAAAFALSDREEPIFFFGKPYMSELDAKAVVLYMQELVKDGYTIITWNGCSFDFSVLAMESKMQKACAELAMQHIDLMLIVTFSKGHFLGFDKALSGAGLRGKQHNGTLNNGQPVENFTGADAPRFWRKGEYDLVLSYLGQDVLQLKELVDALEISRRIRWISQRGKEQIVPLAKMRTVKECFDLPEPDTSWMSNPPKRTDFIEWMTLSL